MKRNHYLVESPQLVSLAESFLDELAEAVDARNSFAEKHRADGMKLFQSIAIVDNAPAVLSITGLRFSGKMPEGFALSDIHGGYAIPDGVTPKGKQFAADMAALPPIPLPIEIAKELNYGSPLKIREDGASSLSVEMINYNVVFNVPVFSSDEIAKNKSLAWKEPVATAGMTLMDEKSYREMKTFSNENTARSSARPHF
jgi:hypothetical protein